MKSGKLKLNTSLNLKFSFLVCARQQREKVKISQVNVGGSDINSSMRAVRNLVAWFDAKDLICLTI